MEGNPAPLQHARAEDFVLAEGFEGGGRDAGDSNCVPQRVEDLDGISLSPVRSHAMADQFDDLQQWRRCSGTSASEIEWLKHAAAVGLFTSWNGLAPDETDRPMLTPFKLNCAEVAPGIPIDSPQTY